MTQDALLLDLDCSADDAGQFLYEDDARSTEARRLALGTVLDLVASAFNMSATPEPIAFDVHVGTLPVGLLNGLRLELNPITSGAFAVHVATRDRPDDYQTWLPHPASAFRRWPRPDGTFERPCAHRRCECAATTWACIRCATLCRRRLGDCEARTSRRNGVAVALSLTPAAREECARFSLHPSAFSVALRAALRVAKLADQAPVGERALHRARGNRGLRRCTGRHSRDGRSS